MASLLILRIVIYFIMDIKKEALNQISWILKNQNRCFILVPIAAFALGGIIAFLHYQFSKSDKYVVN